MTACSPPSHCFRLLQARTPSLLSSLLLLLLIGVASASFPSPSFDDLALDRVACPTKCTATSPRDDTTGARIFYLVLVHNERTLQDAMHLIRAIRGVGNTILIHVDRKASHLMMEEEQSSATTRPLWQEVTDCPCHSVIRVESVHSVSWGQWSMNEPTLWAMDLAVTEYAGTWDVFVNLSGDSMPVYTPEVTSAVLADLPYNFVTSSSCETGLWPTEVHIFPDWWHKRRHYTREGTEPDPVFTHTTTTDSGSSTTISTTMTTHFGSQWIILQADFVAWLVQERQKPQSLVSQWQAYLQASGKLMTDETFLPSLIMNTDWKQTLPPLHEVAAASGQEHVYTAIYKNGTASSMTDVRLERMDEHFPSAFGALPVTQHLDIANSSSVDKPRPWGPYYLGIYDVGAVKRSGALYVRKVSSFVDPNLYRLLPVSDPTQLPEFDWPRHALAVTELPDWKWAKEFYDESETDEEL